MDNNFIEGGFYVTRCGLKAQRCKSEDTIREWLAFRIFYDGHAKIEHYNKEGRFFAEGFDHELDIIGLWDDRLEKTEGWVSEQYMSSILSEQNLIKNAVSAIGKRRRKNWVYNV